LIVYSEDDAIFSHIPRGTALRVIFWSLSLLRRERLSNQFAYEGLSLTGITFAAVRWGGVGVHPIYFLVLLYLITMRCGC